MKPIFYAEGLSFQNIIHYPIITIQPGEMVFLSGESGCGKSTLLKLFNATVNADSGTLLYKNQSISSLPTLKLRREVLLVSQTVYLFEGTIADNFNQYHTYRETPLLSRKEIKQYLQLCRLDYDLDTPCIQLSGGEQQRVFIAIGLSFIPRVLMLDEPTSALDEKTAYALLENIVNFCKMHDMTLITITHDSKLADRFADRKILLERGC